MAAFLGSGANAANMANDSAAFPGGTLRLLLNVVGDIKMHSE